VNRTVGHGSVSDEDDQKANVHKSKLRIVLYILHHPFKYKDPFSTAHALMFRKPQSRKYTIQKAAIHNV
jgi:hypothetical protein